MEKLLPAGWPAKWEEIDRYSDGSTTTVSLAHINPDPENEPGVVIVKTGFGAASGVVSAKPEKYDFVCHLAVVRYTDEQTARQFFENYRGIFTQGLSVPAPGAEKNVQLGDLIKTFAPDMVKEFEAAKEKIKKNLDSNTIGMEKGTYLGAEALFQSGATGKICAAVLIDRFVVTGTLLAADALDDGNKKIHSIKCRRARPQSKFHAPCSTLKAEGFINKDDAEQIILSVFSRIEDAGIKWIYAAEHKTTGHGLSRHIKNIAHTVNEAFESIAGRKAMVTFTTNGDHGTRSRHYSGNAIDLRTKDLAASQITEIEKILKNKLGRDYDVIYEKEKEPHFHIEYDPIADK